MKTRSNMPLFVLECTDITKLTDGQIELLRCGDYLVKKTGKQEHAYKVTYKEDKQGICLTYHDASCVETVSYDYSGGHWVYNSTDFTSVAEPLFENIVDSDGHKRFVEGDITTNAIAGVTYLYSKWSLSGTHLMIVLAGSIADSTVLLGTSVFGNINIPSFIGSKIYPLTYNGIIDRNSPSIFNSNGGIEETFECYLGKASNTNLVLGHYGDETITTGGIFRIAFDLLIDNE